MDINRSRDGMIEHNPAERNISKLDRSTITTGFDGMNFEQERGDYRSSDSQNLRKNTSIERNAEGQEEKI